jgi:hypothetical protein
LRSIDIAMVVGNGVYTVLERLAPMPGALALDRFLEQLYSRGLFEYNEAVSQVRELLRRVESDPVQRERLLKASYFAKIQAAIGAHLHPPSGYNAGSTNL